MRTYAWVAAVLAVALTTGCQDRDRADAGDRVEAAGDRAGDEVRQGANEVGATAEDAADDAGDAAENAADKVGDAADKVGDATEDAAREATGTWTYERRNEYRQEVRDRLDALDRELADLGEGVNDDASEAYSKGVAAARETRQAVGREVERLGSATAANWDEVRNDVRDALDSLDRQVRALRPDARPMGGTGPS